MNSTPNNTNYQAILDFWFNSKTKPMWFAQNATFDQLIKDKFYHLYEQAYMDNLMYWKEFPEGALALVIIFDQFSRNIFRGLPQSYGTDYKALNIAKQAVRQQIDKKLATDEQRQFLYMPFMHSENIADQNMSVELFSSMPKILPYAIEHMEAIKKFGRFPNRNKVLKRPSTKEERDFLKDTRVQA